MDYIEPHTNLSQLPLEPLSLMVGMYKLTSDTEHTLRFVAHRIEAKELFSSLRILTYHQFEEVAWLEVHATLHSLPKMFQMFVGKQVFGVSAILKNLSKQKAFTHLGDRCPSCTICSETSERVLQCREEGRVRCMNQEIGRLGLWLQTNGAVPALTDTLLDFLWTRGTMQYDSRDTYIPPEYSDFIQSQAKIGWRRTREGMVSKELVSIDRQDVLLPRSKMSITQWITGFITRLLEATHGIWIYRNITIHDRISGLVATKGKEQLNKEIEQQIEQGGEGLAEEDRWMLEVNLGNIDKSSGEKESYWLLAIRTARARYQINNSRDTA
jgi:hypothetical protein